MLFCHGETHVHEQGADKHGTIIGENRDWNPLSAAPWTTGSSVPPLSSMMSPLCRKSPVCRYVTYCVFYLFLCTVENEFPAQLTSFFPQHSYDVSAYFKTGLGTIDSTHISLTQISLYNLQFYSRDINLLSFLHFLLINQRDGFSEGGGL